MYNEEYEKQFELFEDYESADKSQGRIYKKLFGSHSQFINFSAEQIIFGSCVLILSLVVVFSLGVDKGSRIASPAIDKNDMISAPVKEAPKEESGPEKKILHYNPYPVLDAKKNVENGSIEDGQSALASRIVSGTSLNKKYALNLVSCKKEESAQGELRRLKSKGLNPAIRKSGKYYVIYLAYNTKESADNSKKYMRPQYKDCFITNNR